MTSLSRSRVLVIALALSCSGRAHADSREGAADHFRVGIQLVDRHQWDSALAEFRRSNELFATSGALENAAVCLRELQRFDEALDTYDELLARFASSLSPANRAAIDADMRRIDEHIGAITVAAPVAGAAVLIDGRERARTPLPKPVRVTAGEHAVRVVIAGRAPFETHVQVQPKQTVALDAELAAVARVGTARVVESSGRVFEVLVDGGRVGVTPWEGTLAAGDHTFALHGEADMGAEAVTRAIAYDDTTTVTLVAHRLPGVLRVEPDPAQATVFVDGARVARGSWSGSVASGDHTVDLAAPWAEPMTLHVHTSSERPLVVRPSLERIRRFYAELQGGILFGDTRVSGIDGCDDASCLGNAGLGHVGYLVARHLGVDAFFGGFAIDRRSSQPLMQSSMTATVAGASVAYEMFERTPLLLRLGFATIFGSVGMSSAGLLGGAEVTRQPTPTGFVTGAIMPEVRFGYRITRAIVVDLGVTLMFFLTPYVNGGPNDDPSTGLPLPTMSHGLAVVAPVTLGFRLFL